MPEQPGSMDWSPTSFSPSYAGRLDNVSFANFMERAREKGGGWALDLLNARKEWVRQLKNKYGGAEAQDALSSLGGNAGGNAGMELRQSTYNLDLGYFEPKTEEGRKALVRKMESAAGKPLAQEAGDGKRQRYVPFRCSENLGEGYKAHYRLEPNGTVIVSFTLHDRHYANATPPPGFYARYRFNNNGFKLDEVPNDMSRWGRGLDSLRYYYGERNLSAYYGLVDKAVGVAGLLDTGTGAIWADHSKDSVSTEHAYAAYVVDYHYGSKEGESSRGASYVPSAVKYASDTAAKGNWMGQYTDDNFVVNGDFGRSPYEMGTMANHYNRLCVEYYLGLSELLSNIGEELPDDSARDIDYSALAARVNDMARLGYSPGAVEEARKYLKEYWKYRQAGERIREMVGSKYNKLQTAQFVVSYCGATDASGNTVDDYTAAKPWWEPPAMEEELRQAMQVVNDYETAQAYGQIARSNGVPSGTPVNSDGGNTEPQGGSAPAESFSVPEATGGGRGWTGETR